MSVGTGLGDAVGIGVAVSETVGKGVGVASGRKAAPVEVSEGDGSVGRVAISPGSRNRSTTTSSAKVMSRMTAVEGALPGGRRIRDWRAETTPRAGAGIGGV